MSSSDSYWRVKDIFADALERPTEDRAAFVQSECAGDVALLDGVNSLLAAHDRAVSLAPRHDPLRHPLFAVPQFLGEAPGTVIGPYTILEQVGEGGMGVVYRAQQEQPIQRIVALKLIKLGMDTRQVIARFESERQALALMNHPNVAAVFDAGSTETGRPYFVMEYVSGAPVTDFCDRHKYSTRQRLELFMQACEAIQHAHQKAIIHRDIKPGNILVTLDGSRPVVKVIDFGVARATDSRRTERSIFTETGQLVGTPEYMSPEQADPNAVDVDTRTDIYSMGVVLYELLAGALPFDSNMIRVAAYARVQRFIRESEVPRPSTRLSSMNGDAAAAVAALRGTKLPALAKELRSELEWIPLKAMRKEAAERYSTATELSQDIRNYLEARPLLAVPESAVYRFRKMIRRNKGPVAAAATVLVVLVVGVVGTSIGLVGQSRQRAIAEEQRAEARKQEAESEKLAAIAMAVSQFQGEMFGSARPSELGGSVTVVDTMLVATKKLDEGRLKDQPLAEANVREMIGRTLFELGRQKDAEPILRKALELRRSALPAPHWGVARAAETLALTLQELGKLDEAETLFRESLTIGRQAVPAGDLDVASTLANLGALLQRQAKYGEAEAVGREALQIHRQQTPRNDDAIAFSLDKLAWVLQVEGKLEEAESIGREALALRRKRVPPVKVEIAESLNTLAVTFARTYRFAEAEILFREMLQMDRENLPANHPRIGQDLNNLASVLQKLGKLADAETMQREGLELRRKSLPPGHPYIAQSLKNLASVLQEQGKLTEAEATASEALAIRRAALPAGHPDIAGSLLQLANVQRDEKHFADAQPLFAEAVDIYAQKFGKSSVQVADAQQGLGSALLGLARFADAETSLIAAEAAYAAHPGSSASDQNKCTQALVDLYAAWNQSDPGKGYDAKAQMWKAKLPGPPSR